MTKRVVIIDPDGTERELIGPPHRKEIREILGGGYEVVRVLRAEIEDRNAYTMMLVHETGLINGLSRNQKATDIYLANVRRQFPDAANPSKAAAEAYRKRFPAGTEFHTLNPTGYEDDPYIAGTVIWFDGWDFDDADEAVASANSFT